MGKGIVAYEKNISSSKLHKKVAKNSKDTKTSHKQTMVSQELTAVCFDSKNQGFQVENFLFEGFLTLGRPCSGDDKETINQLKRSSLLKESNDSSCFYIFFTYNSADGVHSEEDLSVSSMSFSHKLLTLLACEKTLCSLAMFQYLKDNVLPQKQLRQVVGKKNGTMKVTLQTLENFELAAEACISCLSNTEGNGGAVLLSLHIDRQTVMKLLSLRASTTEQIVSTMENFNVNHSNDAYEKASLDFINKYYSQELQTKRQVEIINSQEQSDYLLNQTQLIDANQELQFQNSFQIKNASVCPQLFQQMLLQTISVDSDDNDNSETDDDENQMDVLLVDLMNRKQQDKEEESSRLAQIQQTNPLFSKLNLTESIVLSPSNYLQQTVDPLENSTEPFDSLFQDESEIAIQYNDQEIKSTKSYNTEASNTNQLYFQDLLKLSALETTERQNTQTKFFFRDDFSQEEFAFSNQISSNSYNYLFSQ